MLFHFNKINLSIHHLLLYPLLQSWEGCRLSQLPSGERQGFMISICANLGNTDHPSKQFKRPFQGISAKFG